jgi:Poly(ADP-ribose) polymerase and DNA-Ligase Zn-finger region.
LQLAYFLGTDAGPSTEAEASTSKGKSRKRVNKKAKDEENAKCVNTLNDFSIEYAKSNRSTCRGCEAKIAKVSSSQK